MIVYWYTSVFVMGIFNHRIFYHLYTALYFSKCFTFSLNTSYWLQLSDCSYQLYKIAAWATVSIALRLVIIWFLLIQSRFSLANQIFSFYLDTDYFEPIHDSFIYTYTLKRYYTKYFPCYCELFVWLLHFSYTSSSSGLLSVTFMLNTCF